MSLTANIQSGSHLEIQFSESYITLLFNKGIKSGLFPTEMTQNDVTIRLNELSRLAFIEAEGTNLEVQFQIDVVYMGIKFDIDLGFRMMIALKGSSLYYDYRGMGEPMKESLVSLGIPREYVDKVDALLGAKLLGIFDMSQLIKNTAKVYSRVLVPKEEDLAPCFSILLDFNGIEQGEVNPMHAKSFLRKGQEFALGITAASINRMTVPIREKVVEYVQDNFTDDKLKTLSITPQNSGKLKVKIYIIGIWEGVDCLDPDIDVETTISLNVRNGKIFLKADDTDIEIGNWFTDVVVALVGVIAGGIVGFLIGAIFAGPLIGAAIGGSIVGGAGLFGLHESIIGMVANDAAGQLIGSLFAIPYTLRIAPNFDVLHYFTFREVNNKGIVLSGIQERELMRVSRNEDQSLAGLDLSDLGLPIIQARNQALDGKLKIEDLRIMAVKKDGTRIVAMKFRNDVIMSVDETIFWQEQGLWKVAGVVLIRPKNKRAYYRTAAGDDTNLDNYPTFKTE